MGVEAIHLRVLHGHFLHQQAVAIQLGAQGEGVRVARVFMHAQALRAAGAGGLDHHPAVAAEKIDKGLVGTGGGVEPFAAEVFAKQRVEQELVAGSGGVDCLIIANGVDEVVAALRGQKGVALGVAALVKVKKKVFARSAERLFAGAQKVLPRGLDAKARAVGLEIAAHVQRAPQPGARVIHKAHDATPCRP